MRPRVGGVADPAAHAVVRILADLHVNGRIERVCDVVGDVDRHARVVRRVLQLPLQFGDAFRVVDLARRQRIHVVHDLFRIAAHARHVERADRKRRPAVEHQRERRGSRARIDARLRRGDLRAEIAARLQLLERGVLRVVPAGLRERVARLQREREPRRRLLLRVLARHRAVELQIDRRHERLRARIDRHRHAALAARRAHVGAHDGREIAGRRGELAHLLRRRGHEKFELVFAQVLALREAGDVEVLLEQAPDRARRVDLDRVLRERGRREHGRAAREQHAQPVPRKGVPSGRAARRAARGARKYLLSWCPPCQTRPPL
ncbi:Uncharacterised protein [Burkholderia pseudomallei]|nr:Uncharacterised protein [Burkholderia pseudomallei]